MRTPSPSAGSATIRAECLDWMLILGRRHLDRVLRTYAAHYNGHRPHRALGLAAPLDGSEDSLPIHLGRSTDGAYSAG